MFHFEHAHKMDDAVIVARFAAFCERNGISIGEYETPVTAAFARADYEKTCLNDRTLERKCWGIVKRRWSDFGFFRPYSYGYGHFGYTTK